MPVFQEVPLAASWFPAPFAGRCWAESKEGVSGPEVTPVSSELWRGWGVILTHKWLWEERLGFLV